MVGTEIRYDQIGRSHTKTSPTLVKVNLPKTDSLQAGLPEELPSAWLRKNLARAEYPGNQSLQNADLGTGPRTPTSRKVQKSSLDPAPDPAKRVAIGFPTVHLDNPKPKARVPSPNLTALWILMGRRRPAQLLPT